MRKDYEWRWGKEEQEAFDKLKERITSEPVMIRTLRVMGLVPPQYVIASYRFRLFPLFPL